MNRHSLLLTAPRTLAWIEEKMPPPGAHDILVQTRYGAISIGTELPLYCGTHRGTTPVQYPRMTGYESLATIVACGADVHTVEVGDRIVAFYGHRTHAVLAQERVIRVPPNIADPHALLVILACDTANGVTKAAVQPDEPVMITGAGAIGLLTLFNLKARGIATVDVVEPDPRRRDLAMQFGARAVFHPQQAIQPAAAYQVGFECSSRNQAFQLLQQHLVSGGRLCVLADGNVEPLVLAPAFHEKELHVVGSSDAHNYHDYAHWFFEHVRGGTTPLEHLFEQDVSASNLAHIFESMAQGRQRPLKVLVRYEDIAM